MIDFFDLHGNNLNVNCNFSNLSWLLNNLNHKFAFYFSNMVAEREKFNMYYLSNLGKPVIP